MRKRIYRVQHSVIFVVYEAVQLSTQTEFLIVAVGALLHVHLIKHFDLTVFFFPFLPLFSNDFIQYCKWYTSLCFKASSRLVLDWLIIFRACIVVRVFVLFWSIDILIVYNFVIVLYFHQS